MLSTLMNVISLTRRIIAVRLAVISDIHGNALALEAVLEDLETRDVDLLCCAGDLVGYGVYPNEVIAMIRANQIPTVMGNYDEGVGYGRPECGCNYPNPKAAELGHHSLVWTKSAVTEGNKAYLRGLLKRLSFTIHSKRILIVHGSPERVNEYLFEAAPLEAVSGFFESEGVDILICGHTHLPYHRNVNGKSLINAGSVGKPKDGDPRAGYALININESGVESEIIRVAYNVEAMAKAIELTDLPMEFAEALRLAK